MTHHLQRNSNINNSHLNRNYEDQKALRKHQSAGKRKHKSKILYPVKIIFQKWLSAFLLPIVEGRVMIVHGTGWVDAFHSLFWGGVSIISRVGCRKPDCGRSFNITGKWACKVTGVYIVKIINVWNPIYPTYIYIKKKSLDFKNTIGTKYQILGKLHCLKYVLG